jgi:hypothetical protein
MLTMEMIIQSLENRASYVLKIKDKNAGLLEHVLRSHSKKVLFGW